MANYYDENNEPNKEILQQLAEDCADPDIATIIRCYDIGARGTDIIKQMNKSKVDQLKKCAVFLKIYPTGETTKLKAAIISDIVSHLNCLLRELCGICGVYYNIGVNDTPIYRCIICNQGGHDPCLDRINTMHRALDENQRNAFPFMCTSCLEDHKETKDEVIKVKAPRNKSSHTKADVVAGDLDDTKEEEGAEMNSSAHQKTEDSSDQDKKPICPQYKNGRCQNYETCKLTYNHPRRCRNMLSQGKCRFGNSCRYYHPKLCYKSMSDRKCLDSECRFFHIKKTQRHEEAFSYQLSDHTEQVAHHQSTNSQHYPSHVRQTQPQTAQETFLSEHIRETNSSIKQLTNLITTLIASRHVPAKPQIQEHTYQNPHHLVNQNQTHAHQEPTIHHAQEQAYQNHHQLVNQTHIPQTYPAQY